MAARKHDWLSIISSFVRTNPRLSATVAFELGVMAATAVKSMRGGRGFSARSAKLIEALPSLPHSSKKPAKRRAAKSRPKRRAAAAR